MTIRFYPTMHCPSVYNDITLWHCEHGWCWNIEVNERIIATMCGTLLCGDGCIVHFETMDFIKLPGAVILGVMRKAVRMLAPECDMIYATIEARNEKLIRVAVRLGFEIVPDGGFLRDGKTEVVLLKFYTGLARYIKK